ncbi:metal-dependent hydrolase family protein [Bhargavaea massiliensis]|uniref:metal-dependent hydrolase family protein n=1 Tax=Bhargavaea massiliensis TaxID=2697500 RepID=UPI001BCDA588|nr:amidohydrolase family protein [Bhargavaea massiliensis]
MVLKIQNVTLYTGNGEKQLNTSIAVEGKVILAAGDEADRLQTDTVIDGTGKTVIPGLFDMHVHLGMDGVGDPFAQVAGDTPALSAYRHHLNAQKQLKSGVTSVRNLGSKWHIDLDYRNSIADDMMAGPNVYGSGQAIVMTGGHGYPFSTEADGEDGVRKAARDTLKAGADVIKLMATGGVMTPGVDPGSPQLSEKEMRAAVEEALHAGKTSAAHAQGTAGIQNAVRAEITTIEHGIFLDDETIELMIKHNTVLVPTLAAPYYIVQHGESGGIPAHAVKKAVDCFKIHQESFKKALAAGVRIAAGTDAGTPFNVHGDFAKELELMHEYGMEVKDIINAATLQAAKTLTVDQTVGSLEKGKVADFVILNEDPESDISAFRKIHSVYKEGECVHESANKLEAVV